MECLPKSGWQKTVRVTAGGQELDRAVGGDLHPRAEGREGPAAEEERGAEGPDHGPRRAAAVRHGAVRGRRAVVVDRLHDRRAPAAQGHERQGARDPVEHVREQAVDGDERRDHGESSLSLPPWLAILENFCIFFPSELSLPALLTVTVRVLIRLGKMQQFVSYKISLIFVFYQYTVSCLG